MANFEYEFLQDLNKDIEVRQLRTILFTDDKLAVKLTVSVTKGGEPFDLTGHEVQGNIILPNGAMVIVQNNEAEVNGNKASITLTQGCFSLPGRISGVLRAMDNAHTVLLAFSATVMKTTSDTIYDPSHEIPSVSELIAQIGRCERAADAAEAAAEQTVTNFAPAFVQGTANAAGTYVTYTDGKLYLLPEGHTAGTSWANTTHTETDFGAEVSSLKSQIEDMSFLPSTKAALLNCFRHVAWVDEHGQQYYSDLYNALYNNYWSVTNTLTNCYTSNTATQTAKDESYMATIVPFAGYKLNGATITVSMGGVDITATAYDDGVITIPSVTGALAITVVAADATLESITATYTQSGEVYPFDSINRLKANLVVTAVYEDYSIKQVDANDYTLSGTLAVGVSIITVSYSGKTTIFTVDVSEYVPSEYKGVEWIQSSGTQVIITDYAPEFEKLIDLTLETDLLLTSSSTAKTAMFAGFSSWASQWIGLLTNSKIGLGSNFYFSNVNNNVKNHFVMRWDNSNAYLQCGEEMISRTNENGKPLQFALFNDYSKNFPSSVRIFRATIYDGASTIMDMVPCYRISDSVIGMYDRIGRKFYTNGGTGTFTKGSDL